MFASIAIFLVLDDAHSFPYTRTTIVMASNLAKLFKTDVFEISFQRGEIYGILGIVRMHCTHAYVHSGMPTTQRKIAKLHRNFSPSSRDGHVQAEMTHCRFAPSTRSH
eukprot:4073213-Pleurochrysis_carterae.AAC.1